MSLTVLEKKKIVSAEAKKKNNVTLDNDTNQNTHSRMGLREAQWQI